MAALSSISLAYLLNLEAIIALTPRDSQQFNTATTFLLRFQFFLVHFATRAANLGLCYFLSP